MLMLLMMLLLLLAVPCRLPPWVPAASPGLLGSIFWRMRLKSGSGLVIHRLNNSGPGEARVLCGLHHDLVCGMSSALASLVQVELITDP